MTGYVGPFARMRSARQLEIANCQLSIVNAFANRQHRPCPVKKGQRMQRILIIASAVVVLAGSGAVHGVWTDRWTAQTDLADAAARLERLPMTIGPWHGSTIEMEKDPKSNLAGVIARRYVHATSGKTVTILLGCGRDHAGE